VSAVAEVPSLAASALPLALYAHFPWCVAKCPYCDFNSHGLRGELPEDAYVDGLLADLDHELACAPEPRPVVSIFLGGGTPSLFSDRAIGRFLEGVAARLTLADDIEITLEANPGTVDAGHFAGYRAAGVNRLSLGVQSLDDAMLRRLGRIHDGAAARNAVDLARRAGFDNLNLDLMHALPEQTLAQAMEDLEQALALAPEHLSWYQLTLEPNTPFAARPPALPDPDTAWDMQEAGQLRIAAAGFVQYEVSAYARAGRCARHNLNYWSFGDYLGIGAGAHGKRSFVTADGGLCVERRARRRDPRAWLAGAGGEVAVHGSQIVSAAELPFEYALNALRLPQGFSLAEFSRATGESAAALALPMARGLAAGLLEPVPGRVQPSDRGRALLNDLLQLFMVE
jgi:coproporphyrinogen III oxidase, anaerobic (EC 1.3.99.22)